MDRDKILKMVVFLAAIVVMASSLSKLFSGNSLSLTDYVAQHTDPSASPSLTDPKEEPSPSPVSEEEEEISQLTGASLNGDSCLEQRVTLAEGFYYEPISDRLCRYMTGISFPSNNEANTDDKNEEDTDDKTETDGEPDPATLNITFEELRYVHVLHYDFNGNSRSGELICNAYIAQDLVEIFHELYRNEYKLDKVLLIDEYNGDEAASSADNNTYCFRYSEEDDIHAPKHAQGLAVDINPLYNPYICYAQDGSEKIAPAASSAYTDRSASFPYKIDENDLCYKLFTRHGFTWGGHWNDAKGFQHFQKALND